VQSQRSECQMRRQLRAVMRSALDGNANCVEHLLIAGKSNPALPGNNLIADPDREFAGLPADCFDVNAEFFLEQRRYPSSARGIRRSNQTVANGDLLHALIIRATESVCPICQMSNVTCQMSNEVVKRPTYPIVLGKWVSGSLGKLHSTFDM
jgi:hypothetical protein